MALPTIRPFWMNTYKTPVELTQRRLEKQAQLRSCWSQSERFFKDGEIQAQKKSCWTSDDAVKRSMNAVDKVLSGVHEKERRTAMEVRRCKLRKLLTEESERYRVELKNLRTSGDNSLSSMQRRVDQLRLEKEDTRKKEAEQKIHEHWRQNEPRLRELVSEKQNARVTKAWQEQVDEKQESARTAREEKNRYESEAEERRREALALERLQEEENRSQRKKNAEDVQHQIKELKLKEEEAAMLRCEENRLIEHEKQLLEAEEKRKSQEEQRKRHEHGRVLIRQYKHQLKKKSQDIQESLRKDLEFLQQIAAKEKEEVDIKTARRDKERADAEYMLKVVADQLQLEKCREADLDSLYQEEAGRQWRKREAEWERERVAREKLMQAVLNERQEQIKEKREILQQQQEESIKEREELLEKMEEQEQLTHREEEERLTTRKQREQEIKEQITDRASQREQIRRKELEELEQQRLQEEDYERLLSQEAEQLNMIEDEPPSTHRKKRVAFM